MAIPTKIQHPLLWYPGTSQRKRRVGAELLRPDLTPVDGRSLGDMLEFVYEYARLLVFHEYKTDAKGEGYVELNNWLAFFQKSLPFILNRFSRSDFDQLTAELSELHHVVTADPDERNLRLLIDFCYHDLILPLDQLQQLVYTSGFKPLEHHLDRSVRTTLQSPLLQFIALSNAAAGYFSINRYDFMAFSQTPWEISVEDLFSTDSMLLNAPGGREGAIVWLSEKVVEVAEHFLLAQRDLAAEIPGQLQSSIDHLGEKNTPHLGLLYAFLRLFEHFQGNLNSLTQQHLEFFYSEVLQLRRRAMEPDQAHLVFKSAKHLDKHLIEQGTLFKDAKDNNNADILFSLDDEVVIDRAQVKSLKTLFINPAQGHIASDFGKADSYPVEGVYIAPTANSADGKGKAFQERQSKNWAALGAKFSKYTKPDEQGEAVLADHLPGRIGFVLSSPVLWLNEGKRVITITLTCDAAGNPAVFTECFQQLINSGFTGNNKGLESNKWFDVAFSGEKKWFAANNGFDVTIEKLAPNLFLTFTVTLEPDEPAVAFYNEEAVGECFKLNNPFPLVKIKLQPDFRQECAAKIKKSNCCLSDIVGANKADVSLALYSFFINLKIKDVTIATTVSGVKNIIVQNEESLQDINSLILPFGSRPGLKAEFLIGSKEVFCKNWEYFQIDVEWKDKPDSLQAHYKNYGKKLKLETDSTDPNIIITDDIFKIDFSILQGGEWLHDDEFILFPGADNKFTYKFNRKEKYDFKRFSADPLEPLTVNTRDAYMRWQLNGASFQHAVYPFALATYLLEFADQMPSAFTVDALKEQLDEAIVFAGAMALTVVEIKQLIDAVKADLANMKVVLPSIPSISLNDASVMLTNAEGKLNPATGQPDIAGALQDVFDSRQLVVSARDGIINNDGILNNSIGLTLTMIDDIETKLSTVKLGSSGDLQQKLVQIKDTLDVNVKLPSEPYTPKIKSISIGYEAIAEKEHIEFIHLYPFKQASKTEVFTSKTTLFPTFDDEGTLFIGLEKLTPLSNLNLLLQFAEATADSESGRTDIKWQYLTGNDWKDLHYDFEILSDKTEQLTRSGIVKIALPEDISNQGNTIMPPTKEGEHLFWLKVSAKRGTAGVAELIGVHAQAASVTYQPLHDSDPNRVAIPLQPEQLSKTLQPDFGIRKIEQPYPSFAGRVAEEGDTVPVRMSELLRHKGRSVDAFDSEHLVLDAFPELFKCKCISHTLGLSAREYRRDLEVAPGFLVVAVVPDLTKLEAGDRSEPKVPLSTLTKIKKFLQQRASPFARIRVMNPRYEMVYVSAGLRLKPGRNKDFYREQFKTDLYHFLAPWYLGDSDKLSFGQALVYSDVLGFAESLDYVDHVIRLSLSKKGPVSSKDGGVQGQDNMSGQVSTKRQHKIIPLTARSILTSSPEAIIVEIHQQDDDKLSPCSPKKTTLAAFCEQAKPINCEQDSPAMATTAEKGA